MDNYMKRLAIAGFAVALASSPASAQVLLSDNFNSLNGNNSALNYNGFANWNVVGQVDYLYNYPGISCVGSPSGCVDLDGSGGPGMLRSKQSFNFSAGETFRLSLDVSGSQRGSAVDDIGAGFRFAGNTSISSYLGTGGFSSTFGGAAMVSNIFGATTIAGNVGYSTWSFEFQAAQAGSFDVFIQTMSRDNIGPVIDNVVLERINAQTVVPEPSTWAMLAVGMSALGIVGRRRNRKPA